MRVEVSRPAPAVLLEDRDHLLYLGLGGFKGRRVVVSESDDSPERCDSLVVTGVTAEMCGDSFESESRGDLSCSIDDLGLGLFRSHRVGHSFAEIPYCAAGLKCEG